MTILKIVKGSDDGGVFVCEIQQTLEMQRQGIKVYAVIVGEGKSAEKYKELFDKYFCIPSFSYNYSGSLFNRVRNILRSYRFGKEHSITILKAFENDHYDSIIVNRIVLLFLAGYLRRKKRRPAFWYVHGTLNSGFSKVFSNLILRLYKIEPIANSNYTKETIGAICNNVVYPGFDPTRVLYGKNTYREKLNIKPDVSVYGMAARITPEKAQDIVVKAFMQSNAIKSGAHLFLAGDYDNIDFFNKIKIVAGEYFGKQIHYLGWINDLNNFYESVDVCISAMTKVEAFGISIAESIGAGIPVIVPNIGGPTEMITQNITGWLVDKPNVSYYKEAIDLSFGMRDNWEEMSAHCRLASKIFFVNKNVSKFISIINSKL